MPTRLFVQVTVCGTVPLLIQVTWSPTVMVTVLGTKAKSMTRTVKVTAAADGARMATAMMESAMKRATTLARNRELTSFLLVSSRLV